MKKFVAVLAALILVCLTLASCEEGDPSDKYRYSKPDDLSIVDYSFPVSTVDEETQALIDTAVELLTQDKAIIDLFLNGTLDGADLQDSDLEGYSLASSEAYSSLAAVKEAMNQIYANDEPANFFLSYPSEEQPMVRGDDSSLYLYDEGPEVSFPAYVDLETVMITDHTDTSATIDFTYRGPDPYYFDSDDEFPWTGNVITMYQEDGTWKLDTSFYLYYAVNNPEMPWVPDSFSSSTASAAASE